MQRQYAEQCAALVNDYAPLIEEGEALVKDANSDLPELKAFQERLDTAVQSNTFDKLLAEVPFLCIFSALISLSIAGACKR